MDSDLHRKHHHYHHNNHHQPPQPTGLTRYRSAPSSYFSDLINNGLFGDDDNDPFFNSRVSNTETEKSLMKFMSSFSAAAAGSGAGGGDSAAAGGSGSSAGGGSTAQQIMNQIGGFEPQFVDNVKQEPTVYQNHNQNQNQFQSQSDYNNQPVSNSTGSSTIEDSMDLPGSLLRQNSSPAGFVDHGTFLISFYISVSYYLNMYRFDLY
ncbi:hypothetical protein HanIR_Chr13g0641611 [Helianthus annuus]|nr:hypothetical protein HanIR_Chr13g0641611 [Helianthus annuus]